MTTGTPPKLKAPRVRAIHEDGTVYEVQAVNIDMLAWDRARVKFGWPKPEDAPIVWLNYVAWTALTRTGQLPEGMRLGEFEVRMVEVSALGDDEDTDEDSDVVDPFHPGPGTG